LVDVDQGVLMSPNPRGMLEDFVAGLCVSSSLWIVNPLFKMIQG